MSAQEYNRFPETPAVVCVSEIEIEREREKGEQRETGRNREGGRCTDGGAAQELLAAFMAKKPSGSKEKE